MYSLFVAKARQAADELARLTSAGHKDMEHKVRNVRLGARVGGENPLLLDAIRPSSVYHARDVKVVLRARMDIGRPRSPGGLPRDVRFIAEPSRRGKAASYSIDKAGRREV